MTTQQNTEAKDSGTGWQFVNLWNNINYIIALGITTSKAPLK